MNPFIEISGRKIGADYPPFVIAEIGINHNGDYELAKKMVDSAFEVGCECVKFQSHVIEDEMSILAKKTIPGNSDISIWDIMNNCSLTELEERSLKAYVESKGMIFLSTPFSRAAADRLNSFGVEAFKIGSGECNNYPLIKHIASFGKPIILSTGMNDINTIEPAVKILEEAHVDFALLHCTSIYPTPYDKIRLNAMLELNSVFGPCVYGLSDHSMSKYPVIGAIALGASIVERHFTHDKNINGPDIEISMDPEELKEIIDGTRIVWMARDGSKCILNEEQVTIDFAYSTVVAIKPIKKGELLTQDNIWVKRPGIGEIKAKDYDSLLGKVSKVDIDTDQHLKWEDFYD